VGGSEKVQKCADVIYVLQIAVTRSFQQIPKLCSSLLELNKMKKEKKREKKRGKKKSRKVKVRSAITLSKKGSYLHCK
jgi:hypothetical protein